MFVLYLRSSTIACAPILMKFFDIDEKQKQKQKKKKTKTKTIQLKKTFLIYPTAPTWFDTKREYLCLQ